jgi:hypothetical protein
MASLDQTPTGKIAPPPEPLLPRLTVAMMVRKPGKSLVTCLHRSVYKKWPPFRFFHFPKRDLVDDHGPPNKFTYPQHHFGQIAITTKKDQVIIQPSQ